MLTGDKFMPKLYLGQPEFTSSFCEPFTKWRERNKKFRKRGDLNYIYKNKLDKACFSNNAANVDKKDLAKNTILDKILKDRTYEIARNLKYDGYQRRLPSIVYKFLIRK